MESFQELDLPEFLAVNLKQMNFTVPTPVQAQAIPQALTGKDVIASAQTGTGKTAAFGIPLLAYLDKDKERTGLILTPTRELAMQVQEVIRQLTGTHFLGGTVLLIGGSNMGSQLSILAKKPRLVIGTPGRIIDHLNRGSLSLAKSGFLVLDEADRMLDMGFAPQLEEIRKKLPEKRQTLLFSATIPPDIQSMGSRYLKDPVRIAVGSSTQPIPKIAQMIIRTSEIHKPAELLRELTERRGSIVVFARTQHRVDRVMNRLKEQGLKVTRIHGGRTQSQRKQALDQFREGSYDILVATDIAARGLDIHHIAHVINYDLPKNPEDYIHRVGRTARAGAEGSSLCFITPEDRELWGRILKLMGPGGGTIETKPSPFGDTAARNMDATVKNLGQGPQGSPTQGSSQGRPPGRGGQGNRPTHGQPRGQRGRPQGSGGNSRQGGQGHDRFQGQGRPGSQGQRSEHPQRRDGSRGPRPQGRDGFRGGRPDHRGGQGDRFQQGHREGGFKKEGFFQKLGRKFSGQDRGSQGHSREDRPKHHADPHRAPHQGRQNSPSAPLPPPVDPKEMEDKSENFGNKEEMNRSGFLGNFRQPQRRQEHRPQGQGGFRDRPQGAGGFRDSSQGHRPSRPSGPGGGKFRGGPGDQRPGGFKKPFRPKGPFGGGGRNF